MTKPQTPEQLAKAAKDRRASRDRDLLIKLTEYLPTLKKFTMALSQIKGLNGRLGKNKENK